MSDNANTLGIQTELIPQMQCPHCEATLDVSDFEVFEDIECPACNELIKVPGRLGDFILLSELGRGAMGCVYLAQDESLNRLVALKVIRREYGSDPKMLETVQREAQAMATLNHRNIVQVYSFGRVDEQPYFVMELLQGERLDEMMQSGDAIDEVRILEIAHDVAQGLQAAEKAGLTHGDIKPANILMNEEGVAKVVDFGLAKFMDPDAEIEVWGTPYYIAPEKARKKGEDSRSDQFSLGGTLFHVLAGQPPFDGENPTKVVLASLKEETPLLIDHNTDVTEKTSAVIRRMMDKNPNRRYPTYASLLADIEVAIQTALAAREAKRLEEQRALEKANKSIPAIVWIFLFTILMIGAVIGFFTWKQGREKKIAMSVQYDGPKRELHEPLVTAEVRNMTEASDAIRRPKPSLAEAEKKLETARTLSPIPELHSGMGWYRFLTAGIYFYAQYPDRAKDLLEEVADTNEMMFDGGFVPEEDPRVLAAYALGRIDDGDLEKALKKAQPYYVQLAHLARGYQSLISSGYNPDAGRHFRSFSEYRIKGMKWPYVTQDLTPSMHLTRKKLVVENPLAPNPEATPKSRENKPRPTSTPRPRPTAATSSLSAFRISEIQRDGSIEKGSATTGNWLNLEGGKGIWLTPGQLFQDIRNYQLLAGSDFATALIAKLPTASNLSGQESVTLIHIGNVEKRGSVVVPSGAVLDVMKSGNQNLRLRLRIGDGNRVTHEQIFPEGAVDAGSAQLVILSWDAGSRELSVFQNQEKLYSTSVQASWLPDRQTDPLILFGNTLVDLNKVETDEKGLTMYRAFLMDHVPNPSDIFNSYQDRIKIWNE